MFAIIKNLTVVVIEIRTRANEIFKTTKQIHSYNVRKVIDMETVYIAYENCINVEEE